MSGFSTKKRIINSLLVVILLGLASFSSAFWTGGWYGYPYLNDPKPGIPVLSINKTTSDDGKWTVSWTAPKGSNLRYVLEESAGGAYGVVYDGSGRKKQFTGKRVNRAYLYRVQAVAGFKSGDFSKAVSVRLSYVTPSSLSLPSRSETGNFKATWAMVPISYYYFF